MPPRRHSRGAGRHQQQGQHKNSNIRVVVRIRPQNSREREAHNERTVVRLLDENVLIFDPKEESSPSYFRGRKMRRRNIMQRKNRDMQFAFDHVFDDNCSQQYVYERTTKSIVDSVLNGYNCSVFAYGATGAGKTFTMLGDPDHPGVMFLTMMELYGKIASIQSEKVCDVAVSYLEIYNETIKDLLMPSGPLAVREDPQRGVVVNGLSLHKPKNAKELFGMLEYGNTNRTQHPTDANAQSSRSHAVFQVFVRQRDRTANISTDVRVAKMSLIDLAGSERATVTTNRGARFREGANINRSLLALGNCINALADLKNKGKHIPYRNSKLTRLLKDSLGGNCKTVMIAAVSPSSLSYEDTFNTLRYANRAKEIKSTLQRNVVSIDLHISRYTHIIEELRAEVAELKGKLQTQVSSTVVAVNQPVVPVRENEHILGLRIELHRVFQQRSSIRKELMELESFDRDLTAKILRKTMLMERLRVVHGQTTLREKTTSKLERVIATSTARQKRVRSRKGDVEQRMKENEDCLGHLKTEMRKSGTEEEEIPEVLQETLRMRHLEIELKDGRRQAKHLRKFARHQENHIKSSEKLILRLLTLVRSQYFLIRGSGLVTSDLTNEFEAIQKQVEGEREVMWADQSLTEGGAEGGDAERSGEQDFNHLLNLPILSCVQITPKAPRHRSPSKTSNLAQTDQSTESHGASGYQAPSHPGPSYADTCRRGGITATAVGQPVRLPTPRRESHPNVGPPQRIATPDTKPHHGPQRVATPQQSPGFGNLRKSPAGIPQRIPTPNEKLVPQQTVHTPTPTDNYMNTRVEAPLTGTVEQSTSCVSSVCTDTSNVHDRGVEDLYSPTVAKTTEEFGIDGIGPLQTPPVCAPPSETVDQPIATHVVGHSSIANEYSVNSEVTAADTNAYSSGNQSTTVTSNDSTQGVSRTPPHTEFKSVARTISFEEDANAPVPSERISPVTGRKMTYAEIASSPLVSQPHRTPFANISMNSPRITPTPTTKKTPVLNESFTICKGVLEENFRRDAQNQRRPNRRETFTKQSRPPLHHQRSRSQGHLMSNVVKPTVGRTQHTDTLKKYGLPSMTDNSSGGLSKSMPAYMSMTKAAANKRRGNTYDKRTFSQSSKENHHPSGTRPLFTSNQPSMGRSNLARSFSVGNLRQASKSMNYNRNHSAWNF